MKKTLLPLVWLAVVALLVSCEETLSVEYHVYNYSTQNVTVCYTEQLKPAKDDTERRQYAADDSLIVLPPGSHKEWKYDLGEFPKSQKLTIDYNVDGMGVTPLWNRIKYIIIGEEEVDPDLYNDQSRWAFENDGNNGIYKLFLR